MLDIYADDATVSDGSTTFINWTASNATNCTVEGLQNSDGPWTGQTGREETSALSNSGSPYTYLLDCTDLAGDPAFRQETITVLGGPTVDGPSVVRPNQSFSITAELNGNTDCTLTGGGLSQAVSDGEVVSGLQITAQTDYGITCLNGGSLTNSGTSTVEILGGGFET